MNWLESSMQDVRYCMRQLRQSPGFALVAVMSLALGIGANTAIFQLVDALRLRTLPVERPLELVSIGLAPGSEQSGLYYSRSAELTYAQWEQIGSQQQSFTGVLSWSAARFNLGLGGEARYAEGLYVSGEFFRYLGVNPLLAIRSAPRMDLSQTRKRRGEGRIKTGDIDDQAAIPRIRWMNWT